MISTNHENGLCYVRGTSKIWQHVLFITSLSLSLFQSIFAPSFPFSSLDSYAYSPFLLIFNSSSQLLTDLSVVSFLLHLQNPIQNQVPLICFLFSLLYLLWSDRSMFYYVCFSGQLFCIVLSFFFCCWHLLFFGFETLALLGSIFMSLYYSFLECMFRAVSEFCSIILHACIWTWFHVFFSLFLLAFSIFFRNLSFCILNS